MPEWQAVDLTQDSDDMAHWRDHSLLLWDRRLLDRKYAETQYGACWENLQASKAELHVQKVAGPLWFVGGAVVSGLVAVGVSRASR